MPIDAKSSWIQSSTAGRIDLTTPHEGIVNIEDIAHALSHICRYTGHTIRHYSVAEHSLYVSRRAVELFDWNRALDFAPAWRAVLRREVAKAGLLHDASEAYLGDVSRPLKRLEGMHRYRALEKEWERVIFSKFNVNIYAPEVAEADSELLGTEARRMLRGGPRSDWPNLPAALPGHWFMGWPAWYAKMRFMYEFKRLFRKV